LLLSTLLLSMLSTPSSRPLCQLSAEFIELLSYCTGITNVYARKIGLNNGLDGKAVRRLHNDYYSVNDLNKRNDKSQQKPQSSIRPFGLR
jgi:hypothetical protein